MSNNTKTKGLIKTSRLGFHLLFIALSCHVNTPFNPLRLSRSILGNSTDDHWPLLGHCVLILNALS